MTSDDDARREVEAIDAALAGEPELTELGRLALLLRDERPSPGPAFTREPRRPRRRRLPPAAAARRSARPLAGDA